MKNIGIIGYSDIAKRRIIPGIEKSEKYTLSAIGTRAIGAKYKDPIFMSYDDVFVSNSVDTIYISTPPSMHFEHAMKALENGKNVIIEKPAVLKVEHLETIVKYAAKSKLSFAEALSFEYNPLVPFLSALYKEKKHLIKEVSLTFRFPELPDNNIRNRSDLGGGIANDALVYPLLILQYFDVKLSALKEAYLNLSSNEHEVLSSVFYFFQKEDIFFKIMIGMGYSYKNSIEIVTSNDTYEVPKLFSLKPDEKGLLLKNNEIIHSFSECDQVQLMFDCLHLFQDSKEYFERMFERTKILEDISQLK